MAAAFAFFVLTLICGEQVTAMVSSSLDTHWENFKRAYGKSYLNHVEKYRRLNWEKNVADIIHHNLEYDLGLHSFRKGQNKYADMGHYEFVETFNSLRRFRLNVPSNISAIPYDFILPASVDWKDKGCVTPVKNQGLLGAAWAFSATGALEGQHKKKTGNLVSLSEQNLADCVNLGGESELSSPMDQAFEYVRKNGGIDTEECYGQFTSDSGTCRFNKSCIGATCSGYVDIVPGDESALQKAVADVGPISIAIDASQVSFQLYSEGIYDDPSCRADNLDHAVLIVGYGTENGQDYWLVKNSWGRSWGENGYIRMSRNKNNQCGIATLASYPLP